MFAFLKSFLDLLAGIRKLFRTRVPVPAAPDPEPDAPTAKMTAETAKPKEEFIMAILNYVSGIPALPLSWEVQIKKYLDEFSIPSVLITSTLRGPRSQAVAMFNNIQSLGLDSQRRLYAPPGQKVLDVYAEMTTNGASQADTLNAMTDSVSENMKHGGHMEQNENFCTMDVDPKSVSNYKSAFESMINKYSSKFFLPNSYKGEPVYHVEFTKGFARIVQQGTKALPILILLLGGFFIYQHYTKGGKIWPETDSRSQINIE